ncbi:MAG TPA: class I SAM-dependent methyltransferase [Pseudonocardiaceae bacterium]|nr:class I SAM-dependent methyltransferase [Pseudonocardiaceae bacterium]
MTELGLVELGIAGFGLVGLGLVGLELAGLELVGGRGGDVRWVRMRAEELPGHLGSFRVITFAQSFHWFDRPRVAKAVRGMLDAGGACVHVGATTHRGVDSDAGLDWPRPPYSAIAELVQRYLGAAPRAGKSRPPVIVDGEESEIYRAAGFRGPERCEIPGRVVIRTVDDIVAATFSLSGSTPHLFGADRDLFEGELRGLLERAASGGVFSERMREIAIDIWR